MLKEYYEDYKVGEVVASPGRTITEADIVMYSALTGDWWEGHTNVEFAKTTPFGQRIAHGFLTLCIGTSLLFRLGVNAFLPRYFIAHYGIDKLRFTTPVFIGDTIRCEAELIEMSERDAHRGLLVFKITILNHHNKEVVVYIEKVLVSRRTKQ
jgi:acyl dehydratase